MVNIKNRILGGFGYGYRRQLSRVDLTIFQVLAFLLSFYQIWSVIWGTLDPMLQMAFHLAGILALTFLWYGYSPRVKAQDKMDKPSALDYIAAGLAILGGIYFSIRTDWIALRIPILEPLGFIDIFFGLIFIVLSIEAARRTIGFPIVFIIFIGIGYTLFGHQLDGIWRHREFSLLEVIDDLVFSYNGLWGSPISVAATFVFMFLLFGAFLKKAGAGEFFFQLSTALAGRTRGGAAKVAVLTSAFFGSISGSPTANVVSTGSFTIPVSKRTGYKLSVAAGIEAAASTGGSILPPIMGSSAFLMAAITQIPYGMIAIAAIIPALLYYFSLLVMVHLEALRTDLPREKEENIPKVKEVLRNGWFYFIPFIVLITLLIGGYSPSRTGFFGILSIIIISWLTKDKKIKLKETFHAFVDGAKSSIPVSTACAAAGLIIAGIMSTGLGGKLTSIVLGLTNGFLVPTLFFVMLICIVLGMGMPVAAAYILTAMLAAPALIELGVTPLAAHLFIVYFSIFSAITPPVAVASYAAAGIARENPNQVSFEAIKLGIIGFVIPYMFILQPALLMDGTIGEILIATGAAILGILALSAGTIGWLTKRATVIERMILILSGSMFVFPVPLINVVGIALFIFVLFIQQKRKIKASVSKKTGAEDYEGAS